MTRLYSHNLIAVNRIYAVIITFCSKKKTGMQELLFGSIYSALENALLVTVNTLTIVFNLENKPTSEDKTSNNAVSTCTRCHDVAATLLMITSGSCACRKGNGRKGVYSTWQDCLIYEFLISQKLMSITMRLRCNGKQIDSNPSRQTLAWQCIFRICQMSS